MFIGHFAFGFAAKKFAPCTSMATLLCCGVIFRSAVAGVRAVRLEAGSD